MKYSLLLWFGFLAMSLSAQTADFGDGSRLFVWAESGLILRSSPGLAGEKLLTIPYGAEVELIAATYHELELPQMSPLQPEGNDGALAWGIRDFFMQVRYQGQQGFAFGGYLVPYKAPILNGNPNDNEVEPMTTWLARISSNPDTLMFFGDGIQHREMIFEEYLLQYPNGPLLKNTITKYGEETELALPLADLNDGFLIVDRFLGVRANNGDMYPYDMFSMVTFSSPERLRITMGATVIIELEKLGSFLLIRISGGC